MSQTSSSLSVLHLCKWYEPHVGGVETHVKEINTELVELGYTIKVICEQSVLKEKLHEIRNQVEIFRLPVEISGQKLATWKWMWQHRQLFKASDVVQVHDLFWWVMPVYFLVKSKVFTTFHGWEGQYPVRWQAKFQRFVWNKLSLATFHVGDWIREFYWDKPTLVTYGGVKFEAVSNHAKDSHFEVVFVGRLETENDIAGYIEMVEKLKEKFAHLRMTWLGSGRWESECRKLGPVISEKKLFAKYLENADLVLASSYLSILEGQFMGKVVAGLSSHHLKARYLQTFPGSRYMLLADNPEKLVNKIEVLKSDSKKWQLQSIAAKQFAETQTWSKVAKQYLDLWQKA